MAAKKSRQQPKNGTGKGGQTHCFQSTLTREIVEQLVTTHEEGQDFRNVTAVRCQVHPRVLTRWLKLGESTPDAGLATELFMRMGKVEGDLRAGYVKEVANPISMTEHTEYEEGKPVSKTVEARKTQGIQWLLERRFRQFRADYIPKPDDLEICAMLEPQATVYSVEMVLGIVQQMAQYPERLPEPVRRLFAETDWGVPKEMSDGQAAAH